MPRLPWPRLIAGALLGGSTLLTLRPVVAADEAAPTEEVVVSGEHPGPGLWKVTHGTHVLWILGTVSPIPKDRQWRPKRLESVIASSKKIITAESVSPKIGFFRAVRLLPSALRARFNPDGAVLKDLIPPEQYERWLPLRNKYFHDDEDIERVRPMLIAMQLNAKALEQSGLIERYMLGRTIAAAAKKYKVPMHSADIKVALTDPKETIRQFTETPRGVDVACFTRVLDGFASDVEALRLRANAWAVGDVETLRNVAIPETQAKCIEALTSAPALQNELAKLKDQILYTWLSDVEEALATNDVTLAVVSFEDIVSLTGKVAHLQQRGYTVEAPLP